MPGGCILLRREPVGEYTAKLPYINHIGRLTDITDMAVPPSPALPAERGGSGCHHRITSPRACSPAAAGAATQAGPAGAG